MTPLALRPDRKEYGSGDGPVGRLLVSPQLKRAASLDCFLAASDLTARESAMVAAGRHPYSDELTWATLSHTLWIHRPARVDRWIRCDQQSAVIGTDRALVQGGLIDESGSVVASFSQEGAMRVNRRRAEPSRAA